MKTPPIRLALAAVLSLVACADVPVEPGPRVTDLVDPRIGTGGKGWWAGNAFVGATAPFGMVQAGPDGENSEMTLPWDHCSGYHATDDRIKAFSHTHLHGTGIPDLGTIGFMAVTREVDPSVLQRVDGSPAYGSPFDKATETARPGYYAATLTDPGVRVELTATDLAAVHRYRFADPARTGRITVLVDVAHTSLSGMVLKGGVEVRPAAREVRAWNWNKGEFTAWSGGLRLYVAAEFDRDPVAWGTWADDRVPVPGSGADPVGHDGPKTGAWMTFDVPAGGGVEVRVGVSYVDLDGAAANREADLADRDFDTVHGAARDRWEQELSVVTFEGGSDDLRTIQATSLYHAFLMPNRFSDADGRYTGFDDTVRKAEGHVFYTNFSLWDTYRNVHSLLAVTKPDRQRDMIRSLIEMGKQLGVIPRWPLGNRETNIMIGTSADPVIAESYLKGITDFDVEAAWALMVQAATVPQPEGAKAQGRVGVAEWVDLGYVADDRTSQSVSRSLEFAIDDWAIANFAAALGRTADEATFRARGRNFRNLWDAPSGLFLPRNADGTWVTGVEPLVPSIVGGPYTEGTPLQYVWLVPQDPEGLRDLLGGPAKMLAALLSFFEGGKAEQDVLYQEEHDDLWWMTNPPKHYWHGNEPDIHATYLFNHAGRPDLAQHWIRWVQDTLYTTAADGIPGNDDCGTLGTWFVFSTLGFYPQAGGDLYWIGAPRFVRSRLSLPGGKTLVVEAPAVSDANRYVAGVTLNDVPLTVPWFRHGQIANGGTLRFEMTDQPSEWGRE